MSRHKHTPTNTPKTCNREKVRSYWLQMNSMAHPKGYFLLLKKVIISAFHHPRQSGWDRLYYHSSYPLLFKYSLQYLLLLETKLLNHSSIHVFIFMWRHLGYLEMFDISDFSSSFFHPIQIRINLLGSHWLLHS